jgi:hypothetical protein
MLEKPLTRRKGEQLRSRKAREHLKRAASIYRKKEEEARIERKRERDGDCPP